ncbi:MAG: DUF1905 domain-containing protein [Acidobacteria bacterium]|nr:DUF1905 domain-containing protein [Acidobacteriota bacterium]
MTAPTAKFECKMTMSDSTPVYHYLRFDKELVRHFDFKGNLRRVVCTLNGVETFNCALMPNKDTYIIAVNKQRRDKLGIDVGDTVKVELVRDESKYGFPMPKEFEEVLRQDPVGRKMFEALTPGNQRIMLQLIEFNKTIDKRIARSLAGIELLKASGGEFDYSAQHLAMRVAAKLTSHQNG